jgi:bacteriochlorophyll 4-vinyl reductase
VRNLVAPSGYYLANRMGKLFLAAMEESIGRNGLNALLNLTNMGHYIQSPPFDDLELGFDIAQVSNLYRALETIYGPRGARGLALRSGRALFDGIHDSLEIPTGINDLAFRVLPLQTRLRIAIPALARALTQHSDQICRVEDKGQHYDFTIERCANCWGFQSAQPVCFMTVGMLQEASSFYSRGQEFRVAQTSCRAMGADTCVFQIDKEPIA